MWEPPFEVEPSKENVAKAASGSLATDAFMESVLAKAQGTPFSEDILTLTHEIQMLRKALDWQVKAQVNQEKSALSKEAKNNATIRDLERRISDLISSDQYQRLRQRVRNTLEQFLAEI